MLYANITEKIFTNKKIRENLCYPCHPFYFYYQNVEEKWKNNLDLESSVQV